jgi:hypothetical protein
MWSASERELLSDLGETLFNSRPAPALMVVRSLYMAIEFPHTECLGRRQLLRVLLILAMTASRIGGTAAATPGIPDSMRACVQEQDDSRRLACYDQEMARTEKSYGLNDEQKRKLNPPKADIDVKAQTLSSKVLAVTLRADGRQVITLENGQTWVQGEAFDDIAIHAGDVVTIKSGVLGSFYMYLPSKLRTRVRRDR